MKNSKHYYAISTVYGARVVFDNINTVTVHVFDTPRERDAWLSGRDDQYNTAVSATAGKRLAYRFAVNYHGNVYAYYKPLKRWILFERL